METNITMEHQLNTLGEKSEFSEKELRNQKIRFIHGRLRNKGLAWIFQTWASVSLNGTWKELAVAKRKRVLLKQKLLQATRIFAQSPSVEGEKQVRSTREVLEAEDARIQKQEALLFEKERLEEIDRRASRGSPKQEPRDRIKNVFERRARNKQNINSVLTRFKDAHKIRVRRRLRCVHSAKFDASSAVQKFGALQKNVQAFDTWRCAIIERKQCVETQKDPEERANTMEEDFEAFLNNDPDQRLLSTAWNSTQFQAKQNIADYRYEQTHVQYSLITCTFSLSSFSLGATSTLPLSHSHFPLSPCAQVNCRQSSGAEALTSSRLRVCRVLFSCRSGLLLTCAVNVCA
jgi:hypothetical protein